MCAAMHRLAVIGGGSAGCLAARYGAKAGLEVKVGDVIEIHFGDKTSKYEVVTLSEHVLKEDAAGMYRLVP